MSDSLTSSTFWILTVLTSGRRHGYEILRSVGEESGGRVALKATTLYAALERLERDEMISADGEEIINGRARRYYRITDEGTQRLAEEVETLEQSAQVARARLASARLASARLGTAHLAAHHTFTPRGLVQA